MLERGGMRPKALGAVMVVLALTGCGAAGVSSSTSTGSPSVVTFDRGEVVGVWTADGSVAINQRTRSPLTITFHDDGTYSVSDYCNSEHGIWTFDAASGGIEMRLSERTAVACSQQDDVLAEGVLKGRLVGRISLSLQTAAATLGFVRTGDDTVTTTGAGSSTSWVTATAAAGLPTTENPSSPATSSSGPLLSTPGMTAGTSPATMPTVPSTTAQWVPDTGSTLPTPTTHAPTTSS